MAAANSTQAPTGTTIFDTPSDREITMSRTFDAPRRLVWQAFTDPNHISKWLLGPDGWTMPVCEVDLRKGGKWHFVWRKSDGAEMAMTGEYREVSPNERLVNSETWGEGWPETTNTHVLLEKNGKTHMTQTILYPSKEARDAALKTGMKSGANQSYDRLVAYLDRLA